MRSSDGSDVLLDRDCGDASVFERVLEQLHDNAQQRAHALSFFGKFAALNTGMSTQVFTASTLAHLRWLAAALGPRDADTIQTLLWLLSNMMVDGPTMVAPILAAGVLQTLVPVAPVPPALSGGVDDDSKLGLWALACDMRWVLHNTLSTGSRGAEAA